MVLLFQIVNGVFCVPLWTLSDGFVNYRAERLPFHLPDDNSLLFAKPWLSLLCLWVHSGVN